MTSQKTMQQDEPQFQRWWGVWFDVGEGAWCSDGNGVIFHFPMQSMAQAQAEKFNKQAPPSTKPMPYVVKEFKEGEEE